MEFWKRRQKTLPPPEGCTAGDIKTQSSICTGETIIGFQDRRTGELRQAVCVRTQADIDAYYRLYGFEPR